MEEVWKDIIGYERLYKISNFGRCVRVEGGDKLGQCILQGDNGAGYKNLHLYKEGKQSTKYIHRLVAQAFIPNPENKSQVHHIDHDRSNNRVDNLEWVTPSENIRYGVSEGRINNKIRGKTNSIGEDVLKEVAKLKFKGLTVQSIANELGLPRTTVSSLVNGRSKGKMFEKFYEELLQNPLQ